jgi:hypothetical protein
MSIENDFGRDCGLNRRRMLRNATLIIDVKGMLNKEKFVNFGSARYIKV